MMTALLAINDLSIGERLAHINIEIKEGQQVHFLGANGSGKSTLLSCLADAIDYEGSILYLGNELKHIAKKKQVLFRAYLTQQTQSLPIMPVFQYLQLFIAANKCDNNMINTLCAEFQLERLLTKTVTRLSGGEWQRVRLVAVFLQLWQQSSLEGFYLLLDEPMNHLDIKQQAILNKWLMKFSHQGGTIIMSGHDLNHSYQNADSIGLILEGKLFAFGETQQVMTENNLSKIFNIPICFSQNKDNLRWAISNF